MYRELVSLHYLAYSLSTKIDDGVGPIYVEPSAVADKYSVAFVLSMRPQR